LPGHAPRSRARCSGRRRRFQADLVAQRAVARVERAVAAEQGIAAGRRGRRDGGPVFRRAQARETCVFGCQMLIGFCMVCSRVAPGIMLEGSRGKPAISSLGCRPALRLRQVKSRAGLPPVNFRPAAPVYA